MPVYKEVLDKIKNPPNVFIETGSYYGDGVQNALDEGFKKVHSIELSEKLYKHCVKRFRWKGRVKMHLGDSGVKLKDVLNTIKERSLIFIDAHYCADDVTALGEVWIPVINEMKAISAHPIKDHVLIIDDMLAMNNTHFDPKTGKWAGAIGIENLVKMIWEINPNYDIEIDFKHNQMVCIINPSETKLEVKLEKVMSSVYDNLLESNKAVINFLIEQCKANNIDSTIDAIDYSGSKKEVIAGMEKAKNELSLRLEKNSKIESKR